jgi:hypothetical protein
MIVTKHPRRMPVTTRDTYSHIWPDSGDRTRDAVDLVFGNLADYLRTAEGPSGHNRRSEA